MKKMLVVFFALLSTLSFADMSWDDVYTMSNVIVRFPTIQVHGVFISYDKFCVAGDRLISDSNYRECLEWSNPVGEQDAQCLRSVPVYMETPVKYIETYCANWIEKNDNVYCAQYAQRDAFYPLTVKAEISKAKLNSAGEVFLFTKEYTVPECK